MTRIANLKLSKRVLAIALAVCMLCSVLATGLTTGLIASAASTSYTAKLYYNSANWALSTGGSASTTITGNGTYTIKATNSNTYGDSGISQVMYVDVIGAATSGMTISNVSVKAGSSSVAVTNGNIAYYADGDNYRMELYNQWGATSSNPAVDPAFTERIEVGEAISVSFTVSGLPSDSTEEDTNSPSDTQSPSDSEEEEVKNTATFSYQDCGNWWSTVTSTDDLGTGTYVYKVYDAASWNGGCAGAMNAYFTLNNFYTVLTEAGYTEDDVTADVTIEMDGTAVSNGAYVFVKDNGTDMEVCINNCWVADSLNGATWTDSCVFTIKITLPDEFGTGGCNKALVAAPAEDEEEEEVKTTGKKKDNGYIHDKGAIFVYTGDKYDIKDFVFSAYCYGKIHQLKGEWGAWYDDFADMKGNGIYIEYHDNYEGIGYPAVQLSWDTDRIWYFSLTLRSEDWTFQKEYGTSDGFWRGPKERVAESGEAYLDGSNKWYYFTEGSSKAAETTEDTGTETEAVVLTEGSVNVEGDGDIYAFVAIGADNVKDDWAYQWAGDETAKPMGITANAVKAKVGEMFTISLELQGPAAYTWYVAPTLVVGADKTVDATVNAIRMDGVDVTADIDLAAGDAWWYEDTGDYTTANGNPAVRLAGGYNEWGTKYIAESPAGYKTIEYDITINSIA